MFSLIFSNTSAHCAAQQKIVDVQVTHRHNYFMVHRNISQPDRDAGWPHASTACSLLSIAV